MANDKRGERELLEQRARALARPPAAHKGDTIEIVTFGLAGETYGIESRYVLEVLRLTDLSRLPGAEPPVLGITTWRGALLNILDLRPMLGLTTAALDDLGRLIVLGKEGPAFGVLVDQVYALVVVPASAVRDPSDGVALRRDYLRGLTAEAVIVLAGEKLIALHS